MNTSTRLGFGLSLLLFISNQQAFAGPATYSTLEESDKRPHFRAGVSFRQIGVDFTVRPSSALANNLFNMGTTGLGDVGFFTGGADVVYNDGFVGPVTVLGFAAAFVADPSQITPTGRLAAGTNDPVFEVAFQSTESTVSGVLAGQSQSLRLSDEEISVGPYFQFVYPLKEKTISNHGGKMPLDPKAPLEEDVRFLNAVIGYSYHGADFGTGPQLVGGQVASQVDTTFTYIYESVNPAPLRVIYNAALAIGSIIDLNGNVFDPRQTTTVNNSTTTFVALSATNVDIDLHEIPIGLECGRSFGRTRVALNAGGTLNFVNADLSNQTTWFQAGNPNPLLTQTFRSSDSEFKLGAYVGANLTHPLNEDGSLYLEAHISYRWVDDITATVGGTQVDIDLSSLEGGIGIGIVFD